MSKNMQANYKLFLNISASQNINGLLFPEEILIEILLIVGLESLESLHKCRQVCQTWNKLIMNNIWENPSIKNMIERQLY